MRKNKEINIASYINLALFILVIITVVYKIYRA